MLSNRLPTCVISRFCVRYNFTNLNKRGIKLSCFAKLQNIGPSFSQRTFRLASSSNTTIDPSFPEKLPRPRSSHFFGNWVDGEIAYSSATGAEFTLIGVQQPSSIELVAVSSQCPDDIQSNDYIISAATDGFDRFKCTSWEERACILDRLESLLVASHDVLVDWIVAEVSKPKRLAQIEVSRAIALTRLYAKKVRQIDEVSSSCTLQKTYFESGRYATQTLRPRGPVFAVTPFNFPLNLLLHKFLPAIAAGTSIVVKPSPQAPITAYIVGLLAKEAGFDAFSIVNLTKESVIQFVSSPAFSTFSFTGGSAGWELAQALPISTKPILELGSNAAIVVNDVSSDEQLNTLCNAIVQSSFGFAGQSCESTQRVLVHSSIANKLQQQLLDLQPTIQQGPPEDNDVLLSSMISESAMLATLVKVYDAEQAGAKVMTPTGDENDLTTDGGWLKPLILLNTTPDMDVNHMELFAPILTITTYETVDEAIALVNATNTGIHTGIVTNSNDIISQCQQQLHVRGLIVNDVPSVREDYLSYGGVRMSGIGYEGVATSIEDYSESTYILYPNM